MTLPWHCFEVVGPHDPVNWAWQETQAALTTILGANWSGQIQHEGHCARLIPCVYVPCSPIFDRGPLGYRAVIVVPQKVEAYGSTPLQAFDRLLMALA